MFSYGPRRITRQNAHGILAGSVTDDTHIIPCIYHPEGVTIEKSRKDEQSIADKKREDLTGRVLTTNNLVQYQEGTVASRMIVFKKTGTITLFAFDASEGLSEHSAPFNAILTVTERRCRNHHRGRESHGEDRGEMIILPWNIPHAVFVKERFKMTLTMIRE